jgi:hypothetical protein
MAFLFNIRFPCEAALLGPLRDLSNRVAQYAGYAAHDAGEIGAAISGSAAHASGELPASARDIEIQFHTSDSAFEVTLVLPAATSNPPDGFTCTREGSGMVCRFTRRLPDAFLP